MTDLSLSLRRPFCWVVFFHPPVQLRKGGDSGAWWAPGLQSRSTQHAMSLLASELQVFCHFAALKTMPFISVNNFSKDHAFIGFLKIFIYVLHFIFFIQDVQLDRVLSGTLLYPPLTI